MDNALTRTAPGIYTTGTLVISRKQASRRDHRGNLVRYDTYEVRDTARQDPCSIGQAFLVGYGKTLPEVKALISKYGGSK